MARSAKYGVARRIKERGAATTVAFGSANFRRYAPAQLVSVSGTYMQSIAQALLVLKLGGGGLGLGLLLGAQTLPILLLSLYGGALADRFNKLRVMRLTQLGSAATAMTLGLLTSLHHISLPALFGAAAVFGSITALENPVRQTLVVDMVGFEGIRSALGIGGLILSLGRFIGPAAAGVIISVAANGYAICFYVNALTFVLVAAVLLTIKLDKSVASGIGRKDLSAVREGLRAVWHSSVLRRTVASLLIAGIFTLNLQIFAVLDTHSVFHGGPASLALITSCMGLGAVVGSLIVASGIANPRTVGHATIVLGVAVGFAALAKSWPFAVLSFMVAAAATAVLLASSNVVLQEHAPPESRGRVVAFYSIAVMGTTPVGAPLMGFVADAVSISAAMWLAAGAGIASGVGVLWPEHQPAEPLSDREGASSESG